MNIDKVYDDLKEGLSSVGCILTGLSILALFVILAILCPPVAFMIVLLILL